MVKSKRIWVWVCACVMLEIVFHFYLLAHDTFYVTFHKRHFISVSYHGGWYWQWRQRYKYESPEKRRTHSAAAAAAAALLLFLLQLLILSHPYVVQYCADLRLFDCCYHTLFTTIHIK